jgi:hypothetical protein
MTAVARGYDWCAVGFGNYRQLVRFLAIGFQNKRQSYREPGMEMGVYVYTEEILK